MSGRTVHLNKNEWFSENFVKKKQKQKQNIYLKFTHLQ